MGVFPAPQVPIRVFLADPAGVVRLELFVVRGLDRQPDQRWFHAFGWPHVPVPPGCVPVAEPREGWPAPGPRSRMHIEVEVYTDPAGVCRFKPLLALPQTLN